MAEAYPLMPMLTRNDRGEFVMQGVEVELPRPRSNKSKSKTTVVDIDELVSRIDTISVDVKKCHDAISSLSQQCQTMTTKAHSNQVHYLEDISNNNLILFSTSCWTVIGVCVAIIILIINLLANFKVFE